MMKRKDCPKLAHGVEWKHFHHAVRADASGAVEASANMEPWIQQNREKIGKKHGETFRKPWENGGL